MIIIISPFLIIVALVIAILAAHITAGFIIAALIILSACTVLSLSACAFISAKMAPSVRREPVYYSVRDDSLNGTSSSSGVIDASRSGIASTEVFSTPEIYEVDQPNVFKSDVQQTYKRMIGRRVVEFDARTHQPTDPDQTSLIWRVRDE